jgi:hypothetical protein
MLNQMKMMKLEEYVPNLINNTKVKLIISYLF